MKRTLRTIAGLAAGVSLALLCFRSEARAHGCSSASAWQGISSNILEQSCFAGCHGGSGNGGMPVSINTDEAWYAALVNRVPVNTAASGVGKLRVDPKRAWNSYLLDKLTGDLKFGEGNPMPNLSTGYVFQCPGGVEKIKAWILAGAPACGAVDGDPSPDPALVVCDLNQPALDPPVPPADGVQLVGTTFTVDRPARGGKQVTTLPVGTAPTCDNTQQQCFITGIDITASAGTEYVEVARAGEAAPIAVARGASLSLTLSDVDAGVPIAPNQQLEIQQWIRNDYWVGPAPYTNTTTGAVYVDVHLASSVTNQAQPLRDDTGSQALCVPPQSYGATGGVWRPASPGSGAKVGIWSDRRALETALLDAAGQTLAEGATVAQGYANAAGGPIGYRCMHANGWVPNGAASVGSNGSNAILNAETGPIDASSPLKWGCEETANVPSGLPEAVCGGPATFCASSSESANSTNDCAAVAGTHRCRPANLVYGDGVDDGRCSLVGLSW